MTKFPSIKMSDLKDLSVLFLHPSEDICDAFETMAEQNLLRVKFFSASTLSAGRDLLKVKGCQLAIFQDGVDGKDFIFTQIELKNTKSDLSMIPLIDIPTIDQLSAQRRIGGIYTFGKKVDISSFPLIEGMILNFARDISRQDSSLRDKIEYGKTLQSFLFAHNQQDLQFKEISKKLIDGLLVNYDLGPSECSNIITAEMIYSPGISSQGYSSLLINDKFGLVPWLAQTASWKVPNSKPTSAGGLAITMANYLAWNSNDEKSDEELVNDIFKRPHFLLHPAIRALKQQDIVALLELVKSIELPALKVARNG